MLSLAYWFTAYSSDVYLIYVNLPVDLSLSHLWLIVVTDLIMILLWLTNNPFSQKVFFIFYQDLKSLAFFGACLKFDKEVS